jgi:hypothetical protein
MFCVNAHELLVLGRFGPLTRGATQATVRAALGEPDTKNAPGTLVEPVSIWVYGKRICRGHLEFHFLADDLWMIFADYLPLRRYRCPRFHFDPDCLGGLTLPAISDIQRALASDRAPAPTFANLDPRWSDPPPPASGPRIGTREWSKAVRRASATEEDSASYGTLTWPSGASLGVGYHHAIAASGERLVSEDVALVMTVPMLVGDAA